MTKSFLTLVLPDSLTFAESAQILKEFEREVTAERRHVDFVVDAIFLEVFDSSAVAVLLALRRMAAERVSSFRIVGWSDRLRNLARMYGVLSLLERDNQQSLEQAGTG